MQVVHPTFDDWWQPYLTGTGPAGAYVARLTPDAVERLRAAPRRTSAPSR